MPDDKKNEIEKNSNEKNEIETPNNVASEDIVKDSNLNVKKKVIGRNKNVKGKSKIEKTKEDLVEKKIVENKSTKIEKTKEIKKKERKIKQKTNDGVENLLELFGITILKTIQKEVTLATDKVNTIEKKNKQYDGKTEDSVVTRDDYYGISHIDDSKLIDSNNVIEVVEKVNDEGIKTDIAKINNEIENELIENEKKNEIVTPFVASDEKKTETEDLKKNTLIVAKNQPNKDKVNINADLLEIAKSPLPLIALRDIIAFPKTVTPLFIGRAKSVAGIDSSVAKNGYVFLCSQKDSTAEKIDINNLYSCGVIAKVVQYNQVPNGALKIFADVLCKARIKTFTDSGKYLESTVEVIVESGIKNKEHAVAMKRILMQRLKEFEAYSKEVFSSNVISQISNLDLEDFFYKLVSSLPLENATKQKILEIEGLEESIDGFLIALTEELEILKADKVIKERVDSQIKKNNKEYYLNEQVKAIKSELGDSDGSIALVTKYERLLKETKFSEDARKKAEEEIKRLQNSTPMTSESTRAFLEVLFGLPWGVYNRGCNNIISAINVLKYSHYGLEKVKESILEYLSVQMRSPDCKGAILCLYGSPGVGKTTLVKSIAKAMGRKYAKISLGGVKDEAEIRGHRRTYVGAMPGKIIQSMKRLGVCNPVILLDEIDKMSHDYKGDPESALLEVLDPEQNNSFQDHYLEVGYDLSKVMFVATANSLSKISRPLLDRLEIVHVSSYLEEDKLQICKNYITKKQLELVGLDTNNLKITDNAIRDMIKYYTREAGVRELDRLIAKIIRKALVVYMVKKSGINETGGIKNIISGDIFQDDNSYYNNNSKLYEYINSQCEVFLNTFEKTSLNLEMLKTKLQKISAIGEIKLESLLSSLKTIDKSLADLMGSYIEYLKLDIHVLNPKIKQTVENILNMQISIDVNNIDKLNILLNNCTKINEDDKTEKTNILYNKNINMESNAILDKLLDIVWSANEGLARIVSTLNEDYKIYIPLSDFGKKEDDILIEVNSENLEEFLGVRKYTRSSSDGVDMIGVTNGLAYTEVGGEVLLIEAVKIPTEKSEVKITGMLGNVMKESVEMVIGYVRSRAEQLGININHLTKQSLHIHFPDGSTPKDGPSAGIAICTTIISLLKDIPVRHDVAMTGEITLRGRVLPIGGLREKMVAALRIGIKTVIIPEDNKKDLQDIPDYIKNNLTIVPCSHIDDVLKHALAKNPFVNCDTDLGDATIAKDILQKVSEEKIVLPEIFKESEIEENSLI